MKQIQAMNDFKGIAMIFQVFFNDFRKVLKIPNSIKLCFMIRFAIKNIIVPSQIHF